jgi:hypothetical protein
MKLLLRWLLVVVFAIAMAWVETASVYYIRLIVDRVDPYQLNPLPVRGPLEQVELVREAATLIMLFAIGAVTGRTWRARLGYTAIAFGVWDIFYYVFLTIISGWPTSLFDWDILFLLPLPWWGPVFAPVSIALLMIAGGTLITSGADAGRSTPALWRLNWIGVALALYVFMEDSVRALPLGIDATRTVLPASFNWPVFAAALALMATPVAHLAWRTCRGDSEPGERAIRS